MTLEPQQIAQGLRGKDVAILQALAAEYQGRLLRYLVHLLGQSARAEDLVQETWLRVLEHGSTFNAEMRFEPWLFRIARNLAMDDLRKRQVLSLDEPEREESGQARADSIAGNMPSPFALAARSQDARRLGVCLDGLDAECREVLVLRFGEELSLIEISALVGKPVPTVASMIYRNLARLRGALKEANLES